MIIPRFPLVLYGCRIDLRGNDRKLLTSPHYYGDAIEEDEMSGTLMFC
jgi:hypothetical protein